MEDKAAATLDQRKLHGEHLEGNLIRARCRFREQWFTSPIRTSPFEGCSVWLLNGKSGNMGRCGSALRLLSQAWRRNNFNSINERAAP